MGRECGTSPAITLGICNRLDRTLASVHCSVTVTMQERLLSQINSPA